MLSFLSGLTISVVRQQWFDSYLGWIYGQCHPSIRRRET
jgi:hypothetical protein